MERIDFRDAPGGDSTYYRGEIVRVRVHFTRRIAVDASGGLPSVDLTVGTETRRAVMGPRSWNRNRLELRYTVQEGDMDANGVSVRANSLSLNGAVVTAENDASVQEETVHGGVEGGASRKVDGSQVRPQGPTLSAGGMSVAEGRPGTETEIEFAVWLGPPATTRVTVDYSDAERGTATSGEDYAAVEDGTLTFEPGETLKTVSVTVRGDDEVEGDETVVLALSGATGAQLATRRVTGTIVDDEESRPTVSIDSVAVHEPGPGETVALSFTVSLSAPTARQVTVRYRDAGTGTATPGADYDAVTSGTVVFAPGDTAQTMEVTVRGDALDEPAETIVLTLANPFNADLPRGSATGVGTIVDDDAPTLSANSPSVEEGNSGGRRLTFALALDRPSGHGLVLHYADAGTGTATSGTDYEELSPDTLFFAPGETTKSIDVIVLGDTLQERDETVVLRLSSPDSTVLVLSEALVTGVIRDDDDLVPSFGDASVPPQRWIRACEVRALQMPPAEGGDSPLTYGLAPALPSGMKFDAIPQEDDANDGLTMDPVVVAQSATPTVTRIVIAGLAEGDSTYYRGEIVRVRVHFTPRITVDASGGLPYVDLTVGTTTRRAQMGARSWNQNRIEFRYTVQATDFDGDGVSAPANGLKLNGAKITAQNDTSVHANVAYDSAVGGMSSKVDGSKYRPPRVGSVTFRNSPASGNTYGYGERIEARVVFDHRVLVTTTSGTPTLALTVGAHTRQATLVRAGRRTRLDFSYIVQVTDLAPTGASIAANAVRLNGATITHDADTATHAVLAHGAVAADSTRKVNGRQGRPPKVEAVAFAAVAPKDSVYLRGDTIAVRVAFDDSVAVNTTGGKPQVVLTIGTVTRQATFSAHAGKALEFMYVVQATDRDTDGVSIAANALALNGATIRGIGAASARDADVTHPLVAASMERTVDGSKVRAPRVRSVAFTGSVPAGGTYHYDAEVRAEVVFDRGVVVDTASGKPRLELSIGTQRRHAAFVASASTGTTLVFAYRVQSADVDTDGASVGANALGLNGGAIRAAADSTVSASVTHDGLASDLTRKVDGRPRITGMEFHNTPLSPRAPGGVYGYEERIWVLVRFDQKMVLRQWVHLPIEVGTDTVRARLNARPREEGRAVVFYYVITRDAVDTDGVSVPKGALQLSGGWLRAASDGVTDARLEHDGLAADSSWRVNGRLTPVPRPVLYMREEFPAKGDTYTRHERIDINVSYSVAVAVTGTPELTLNLGTGTRQLAAVGHRGRGLFFEYVVQAGDVDADGISVSANALSLPSGATIRAAADTSVVASLMNDSLPASAAHKVDGNRAGAAEVVSLGVTPHPSSDSTYTRGEELYVAVHFDRDVAVNTTGGRPRVALEVGDSTRHATYYHPLPHTSSQQLFVYVVQAGDVDADGLSIGADALEMNGGAITAPDDTVRADLSHRAWAPGSAYKVDGSRAGVPHARWMWFNEPAEGDTYLRGERIWVTLVFDRSTAVDPVGGRPRIALQVGDSTRYAMYPGGSHTGTHFGFQYVVQAGDVDADGLSIGANALELNGGSFTAPGDTTATAVLTHGGLATSAAHKVDGSRAGAAKVVSLGVNPQPSSDSTYTRGEELFVNVHFDRDVAVDTTGGRPRVALEIGDSTRHAAYAHQFTNTPSRQLFHYVVQAGDVDADGLGIGADAVELNGGAITAPDDTVSADLSHDALVLGSAFKVDGSRAGVPHARWMWFNEPAEGDTYLRGERVDVTLVFDRLTAVDTVGGQPRIALQVGDSTRYATYSGGSHTGTHFGFGYVVQATDRDVDGLSIGANALQLNGGSFTAPGDTMVAAVLTHGGLATSAGHKVDGSRTSGDAVPEENRAPEVVSAIAPMTMEVASPAATVDLSAHFRDPDGDELRYVAVSAAPGSVGAEVAASALTVVALAVGESLVTVRAADPDGAEAAQSFVVTVEASRADRARIMKRSLAAFGRAVGAETVEAIGGRLGAADDGFGAAGVGPGAMGEAHLQVGGRRLSCVGGGDRCGLGQLARQAAGVLGLRMSHGAGSLGSALWAAAKGGHDAGALRGLAGAFGRASELGSAAGYGAGSFGAFGGLGSFGSTAGLGASGSFAPTAGYGSAARYGAGSYGTQGGQLAGPDSPLAGQHGSRTGWGRLISMDPVSREELLTRSSFRFSPGAGGRGTPGAGQQGMPDAGGQATPGGWTFWGQANAGGFKGQPEDDLALDGTVRSAYLGADYRFGTGPLIGLALSRTTSSIGFESGINGTGTVDARLTSLYPYAQWSPRTGLSLWGLVGAGRGTAELLEDATGREFATDIGMAMTAAGVRQRLTGVLAVKADAFVVRTDAEEVRDMAGVVATVQRLRVASEVGGRWGLSTGSTITSRVELGARFDGGDAETGAGAEAGAGIGYAHEGIGLTVDARGRALVAHQASSLRDWGASVAVRLRPSREAGGLSMTLEPTWGNAASGMGMLWRDGLSTGATGSAGALLGIPPTSQASAAGALPARPATTSRLRMELDYAIVLPDGGRLAPFGRWTAEGGSARRLNVGLRLSVLEAATLDLFGEQLSGGLHPTDRRLGLQGALQFR